MIGGTIFAPPEDSGTPYAKNSDVRVRSGSQLVGTNSQGEFNLILGRLQYAQLMGRGDLEINIASKDGYAVGNELLTYRRLAGRFEDLYLTFPSQVSARPTVGSRSNPLVVTLHAQSQSDEPTGPRLFLRRIIPPAADIKNVDSSTVRLIARSADDRTTPLLASRTPGVSVQWLPVPRSGPAFFDFDYYFALGDAPLKGIELTRRDKVFGLWDRLLRVGRDRDSVFSFPISDALRQGRITALNSESRAGRDRVGTFIDSQRLRIEVLLLSPYNVNLNLGSFGYLREELTESLVARGFLPIQRNVVDAFRNPAVLSAGNAVPFESVQSVLQVVHDAKVPLDFVAYDSQIPAYEIGSIRVSQRYFGAFRCFSWVI